MTADLYLYASDRNVRWNRIQILHSKGDQEILPNFDICIITRDVSKVRSHCFDLEKYAASEHET